MTTALLDGDMMIYQVASACEMAIEWDEDLWTLHGDFRQASQMLEETANRWMVEAQCSSLVVCLSGTREDNWRRLVYPPYKHNRKSKRKPLLYKPLFDACFRLFETQFMAAFEGDDMIGWLSRNAVMVSDDKDMQSIPGVLYQPTNQKRLEITTEQADRHHLFQTLTGDSVDGYPGCPGVGPVMANRILDDSCTWAAVVQTYEKKGLTEDDALAQARVARITRPDEIENGEVVLWQPV